MSKATVNIEGFVASDPEILDGGGKQVVTVDVPHTPRKKNERGEWVDAGQTVWFQAAFWEELAPVIAATVRKGTLVRIEGMPELNVYQKQSGETAASIRLKGATLSVVARAPKSPQSGAQGQPAQEPWAQTPPASTDSWAGGGNDAETPF